MPLRLGTRASALARWQADWVAAQLRERNVDVELVLIATTGDQQQGPLQTIDRQGAGPTEGLFTKEIQRALLDGRIDLAVHSLKDLPTGVTPDLCLAAVPERAPVADVLVSTKYRTLDDLPAGATIGTGSLRRRAQLLRVRSDLQMKDVRGNVETRLRKVEQGDFDALILAEAGLRRLGLEQHIAEVLPLQLILPAVGQGALGLETRTDDSAMRATAAALDHPPTHAAVLAEREMLAVLQGGCLAPIAALGRVDGERLTLIGRVIACDGSRLLETNRTAAASDARQLGRQVAESLLARGAAELIATSRGQ
jgi:hydroxymethylbilane synthase